MKIAIISPAHPMKCPYICYYTDVLDNNNIEYDILFWNRNNNSIDDANSSDLVFNYFSPETNSPIKKVIDYVKFANFIKLKVHKNKYDFLIIHDLVSVVFLSSVLKRYTNKYILDIRDYSPIYPLRKKLIQRIIENSAFTAISSQGYLQWLPKNKKYVVSHNIRRNKFKEFDYSVEQPSLLGGSILTIGQIRNFSSNSKVIDAFGNRQNFELTFSGYGIEYNNLQNYSIAHGYKNVFFSGPYNKENESEIVNKADIINILLPDTLSFNTLLSNRFYLSLIHKKPMIVNEESIQAKFVGQFNLGIIIKPNDNIYEKVNDYKNNFNHKLFFEGCSDLLKIVKEEVLLFEKNINSVIQENR